MLVANNKFSSIVSIENDEFSSTMSTKTPQNTPTSSRQEKVIELAEIQFVMEECDITKTQLAFEQSAQINTLQSFRHEEEFLRLKS